MQIGRCYSRTKYEEGNAKTLNRLEGEKNSIEKEEKGKIKGNLK
jgi:hypothetical protein